MQGANIVIIVLLGILLVMQVMLVRENNRIEAQDLALKFEIGKLEAQLSFCKDLNHQLRTGQID